MRRAFSLMLPLNSRGECIWVPDSVLTLSFHPSFGAASSLPPIHASISSSSSPFLASSSHLVLYLFCCRSLPSLFQFSCSSSFNREARCIIPLPFHPLLLFPDPFEQRVINGESFCRMVFSIDFRCLASKAAGKTRRLPGNSVRGKRVLIKGSDASV